MKFHALLSILYFKDGKFRQTLKDELKAVMANVYSSEKPLKQPDYLLWRSKTYQDESEWESGMAYPKQVKPIAASLIL